MKLDPSTRNSRFSRVRQAMKEQGVDALLLSVGADLPWLCGYEAMPLERLTMLVVPDEGHPTLVVPQLEAPRVEADESNFAITPFAEGEDPIALVSGLVGAGRRLGIGDRTWSQFLVALQKEMPQATWDVASRVTGPIRAIKDPAEVEALAAASAAADRVAVQLLGGEIRLVGRSEAEVSADISSRLIAEGHNKVNFAIVGSGPNSASPHHEPGERVIGSGEAVVCDFGGTMNGYCSDTTRTVFTGEPTGEMREMYQLLQAAQADSVRSAVIGASCESVDRAARGPIVDGGYGHAFIHRTGHGIGVEEHEDPYIVEGNATPLVEGHAFSVEPGIYLDGRFGARIEDIVVATADGPRPLNLSDHSLTVVA